MSIWSRKSVALLRSEALESGAQHLRRTLGPIRLTAFGVGCTVGAGVFVLTGTVAAHHAGPAVSVSFALAAAVCLIAGLCYAEFAALVPVAGSAYSYAYATLGELVAWLIGWTLMLEYMFSASLVAIGWSGYLTSMLGDMGWRVPGAVAAAPFTLDAAGHFVSTGAWINLPAALVTLACTVLLVLGTNVSASINVGLVAAKVAAILAVIAVGSLYVHSRNWHPFIPPNSGDFGHFGWSGVMAGAGIVFFSYLGFDAVSTLAEETKNPQRTVPLSLFASLLICTLLYVGVSIVVTGLVKYSTLDVPDPLYSALAAAGSSVSWLKIIVAVTAILGLVSVILTCLIGQVRIFFAMARDGLLPTAFASVHPRLRTPHIGTLVTGAVAALTAGLVPLDALGELISIGTLLAFAIVCGAIPLLRSREGRPGQDLGSLRGASFRTPFVPALPLLGVISCLVLMYSLPNGTWVRLVVWLAVGLAIYAGYGHRHSKLRTGEVSKGRAQRPGEEIPPLR
jgi:basic amino acid/polyamine antiporter, APA family